MMNIEQKMHQNITVIKNKGLARYEEYSALLMHCNSACLGLLFHDGAAALYG